MRRLRSARSALPLVLLVAALTALMHASPAHACESAAPTAAMAHPAAHHAMDPAQPASGALASAAPAPGSPGDDDAGQHCTSASPPQAPVLSAGALVTTVPVAAPDAARPVVRAPSTADRGPPTAPRPLLCVWRV